MCVHAGVSVCCISGTLLCLSGLQLGEISHERWSKSCAVLRRKQSIKRVCVCLWRRRLSVWWWAEWKTERWVHMRCKVQFGGGTISQRVCVNLQAEASRCRFACPPKLKIFQLEWGINAGIPNRCWKCKDRGQDEMFSVIKPTGAKRAW